MTTATATRKPPTKPARRAELLPEGCGFRILRLKAGKASTSYFLTPLASDFGTAYQLEKIGGDEATYHVNLGGGPLNSNTCECLGHLKHGHRTVCKHVASLLALRAAGRLA